MPDLPPAAPLPQPTAAPPPKPPSRAPFVAFIIVAVLVVVASGVLVYELVGRGGPAAAPGTTQGPATASQTATPLPAGAFTNLQTATTAQCQGHGKGHRSVDIQFSWSTTDATQVWVAPGSGDAQTAGGQQVPLSGNQDSLTTPLTVSCDARDAAFTLTLVGADGAHQSRSWTVAVDSKN
jgi:hypothetical protein